MRKKLLLSAILLAFGLTSLMPNDAFAGRDTKRDRHDFNLLQQKDESEWYVEFAPYLWFAGIDGDVSFSRSSPTFSIDADFDDLVDDIEFTFAFNTSIKKGEWGYYGDFFFIKLDQEGYTPARLFRVTSQFDEIIFTNAATYYLYKSDTKWIEGMIGARLWALEHDINIYNASTGVRSTGSSGTEEWLDPFIGIRTQWNFARRWYLGFMINYGGFNVGSEETYETFGGLGFRFNKGHAVRAGFKAIGVNYDEDGFLFDVDQKGTYLAYFLFF